MKKVSIIGFGRFGKTLFRLIKDDFDIKLFDSSSNVFLELSAKDKRLVTSDISEIYLSDVVFFAVPISNFENTIKEHKKYFRDNQLLVDVLSVKVHAFKIFTKYLKDTKAHALLTHPMFGPDSSMNGFANLPLVMDKFKSGRENYTFWKEYFTSKGLKIVEISAENHDKLSAKSQTLAHFIGRGLKEVNHKRTSIDTKGAELLSVLMEMTTSDTKELFKDMNKFNPYAKRVRMKFIKSIMRINNELR